MRKTPNDEAQLRRSEYTSEGIAPALKELERFCKWKVDAWRGGEKWISKTANYSEWFASGLADELQNLVSSASIFFFFFL